MASKLEFLSLGAGAAGFDVAAIAPDDALGFSAVHFAGGGFAGFPQAMKATAVTKLKP